MTAPRQSGRGRPHPGINCDEPGAGGGDGSASNRGQHGPGWATTISEAQRLRAEAEARNQAELDKAFPDHPPLKWTIFKLATISLVVFTIAKCIGG